MPIAHDELNLRKGKTLKLHWKLMIPSRKAGALIVLRNVRLYIQIPECRLCSCNDPIFLRPVFTSLSREKVWIYFAWWYPAIGILSRDNGTLSSDSC